MKKNICLNCLDKLIREREEKNNIIHKEKEQVAMNVEILNQEVESEEFSKAIFIYFQYFILFDYYLKSIKLLIV